MIFFLLFLFLIVLGLLFSNVKLVYYIQLVFMLILIGLNTNGIDMNNYLLTYKNIVPGSIKLFEPDFLYYGFMSIIKQNGLTFVQFNFLLTFVAILIIFYVLNKTTNSQSIVLSFFYIYPLIDMAIQKRNFIAMSFLLLGFYQLRENNKAKSIIFILIASGFHSSMLVYLIIPLIVNIDIRTIKKWIPIALIIEIFLTRFIPNIALLFFPNNKINLYFFENRISVTAAIAFMIIHLVIYFLITYMLDLAIKDGQNVSIPYLLNLLCLFLIPLYIYNSTFIRIYRNVFIIFYIILANIIVLRKGQILINKFVLRITILSIMILLAIIMYVTQIGGFGFDITVKTLFENNVLFK